MKIVVVGGGSSYTPELLEGMIQKQEKLDLTQVVLVDIPQGAEKVQTICDMAQRMVKHAGKPIQVSWTFDLDAALPGAQFVLTQIRAGGLDARDSDECIPMKYGLIGQETTGAGGAFNALRTIPVVLEIARKMERYCPDAFMINFTNPSGIVTEAVLRYTKIRCIGLCNVPILMETEVAKRLGVDRRKIYCNYVGLNHLGCIYQILCEGKDVTQKMLMEQDWSESIVKNIPDIGNGISLNRMMGAITSPYFNYYLFRDTMYKHERDEWERGVNRARMVKQYEQELFAVYRDPTVTEKPKELEKRGGALYSTAAMQLVEAIYTDSGDIQIVNTANRGLFPALTPDSSIETNCIINRNGATPLAGKAIPKVFQPLVAMVKQYENTVVEAAAEASREKAVMALALHPLVMDVELAIHLLDDAIEANPALMGYLRAKD